MDSRIIQEADHISDLLYKKIVGSLTEAEQQELDAWSEGSDHRKEYMTRLLDPAFLEEERRQLKAIDSEGAMQRMLFRLGKEKHTSFFTAHSTFFKVAAAIAVILTVGTMVWWNRYSTVVPPELTPDVQLAMQRSMENGHQEAVIEEILTDEHGRPMAYDSKDKRVAPKSQDKGSTVGEMLAARRVTTHHDKEYWITLSDGTLVHLNYNSSVIYPEKFSGDTRDVILDGEAYFMVAKDRRHPFVVHTPNGDVKEYGTEFNVNTRAEKGTEVVLIEGSISVIPVKGKEHMMQPGQMAQLTSSEHALSITQTDIVPYVAWNTGKFSFKDESIDKIMNVIGRWYGYRVEFANDKLKDVKLSGNYDRYDNISTTLESLEIVTGLHLSIDDNSIIIQP